MMSVIGSGGMRGGGGELCVGLEGCMRELVWMGGGELCVGLELSLIHI